MAQVNFNSFSIEFWINDWCPRSWIGIDLLMLMLVALKAIKCCVDLRQVILRDREWERESTRSCCPCLLVHTHQSIESFLFKEEEEVRGRRQHFSQINLKRQVFFFQCKNGGQGAWGVNALFLDVIYLFKK